MANKENPHPTLNFTSSLPLPRRRSLSSQRFPFAAICVLVCLLACSCSLQPEPGGAPPLPPTASSGIPAPTLTSEPTLPPPFEPTQADLPTLAPSPLPPEPNVVPTQAARYEFDAFVQMVMNGNPNEIVGVYVENVLALRVVQQPNGDATWISTSEGEATEFLLAFVYAGNVGLLAHNYLSGRYFFNLKAGDLVELIYGDGSIWDYEVNEIRQYQALQPLSVNSDFIDLQTGETLTATNLFYAVYGGDHHLTFQTCINRDNDSEWGRLFPIAYPAQ